MLCCENCFTDSDLKDYIHEHGIGRGRCEFCDSDNVIRIESKELCDLFLPVINLYSTVDDLLPLPPMETYDGQYIWEKLLDDWDIFELEYKQCESLLRDMLSDYGDAYSEDRILTSYVERPGDFRGTNQKYCKQLQKRWDDFSHELIYENRFFRSKGIALDDLEKILQLLESRRASKGKKFYRARISRNGKIHACKDMGMPEPKVSIDGRVNPRGIPCLYLSTDIKTAISEKRPSTGDVISVGTFRLKARSHYINLKNPEIRSPFIHKDLEFVMLHMDFLRHLGDILTRPISSHAGTLEYIPTQYLCEFIRTCGYDGILYKSSVGVGDNIASFEDTNIECIQTHLYKVTSAEFEFELEDTTE